MCHDAEQNTIYTGYYSIFNRCTPAQEYDKRQRQSSANCKRSAGRDKLGSPRAPARAVWRERGRCGSARMQPAHTTAKHHMAGWQPKAHHMQDVPSHQTDTPSHKPPSSPAMPFPPRSQAPRHAFILRTVLAGTTTADAPSTVYHERTCALPLPLQCSMASVQPALLVAWQTSTQSRVALRHGALLLRRVHARTRGAVQVRRSCSRRHRLGFVPQRRQGRFPV